MVTGGTAGTGGGCIELVTDWEGDACIGSSTPPKDVWTSAIGDSNVVLLIYLGVMASDDGGDMYCSTPISIGKVWLRGR